MTKQGLLDLVPEMLSELERLRTEYASASTEVTHYKDNNFTGARPVIKRQQIEQYDILLLAKEQSYANLCAYELLMSNSAYERYIESLVKSVHEVILAWPKES